jgi:glyceraldehyde-3-phosphate dehydrogenase/erythrose-4-phosphate dehydrogenase
LRKIFNVVMLVKASTTESGGLKDFSVSVRENVYFASFECHVLDAVSCNTRGLDRLTF